MTIQAMLRRLGLASKSGAKPIRRDDPVGRGAEAESPVSGADVPLVPIAAPEALDPATRFFASEAGLLDELLGTVIGQLTGAVQGRSLDPAALAGKVRERRDYIRQRSVTLALSPRAKLPVTTMPAAIDLQTGGEPELEAVTITDLTVDAQVRAIGLAWERRDLRALFGMQTLLAGDRGSPRANLARDLVNFLLAVEYLVPDEAAPLGEHILDYDARHALLPSELRALALERTTLAHSKLSDFDNARRRWLQRPNAGEPGDAAGQLMYADMVWPHDPDAAIVALEVVRSLDGKMSQGHLLLLLMLSLERKGIEAAEALLAGQPKLGPDAMFALYNIALRREGFASAQHYLQHAFTMRGLGPPRFNGTDRFDLTMMASDLVDLPPAPAIEGERPLVTVIVTAFNAADTIAAALKSLQVQTWPELEILVVDDRSTDDTTAIVEAIAAADPRVRLLSNQVNIGTYMSRNRAMAQARGEYVTFQDSDDWSHPQRIERHMEAMLPQPHVMVSKSQWVRILPDGTVPLRRWSRCFAHLNPSSLFFRREAIEIVGYFDAVRADADFEMARRIDLAFAKAAVTLIPLPLSFGFVGAETLTRSGPTGMDAQGHSAVRSAYKAAWVRSYGERLAGPGLALPARPEGYLYPVPPEIAVSLNDVEPWFDEGSATPTAPAPYGHRWGERPPFWFVVSLASSRSSQDRARTVELFRATLRSILNQDDPDIRVVAAGHEMPDLPEMADPRVSFILSDRQPPITPEAFGRDEAWTRRLALQRIKDAGGGYVMPVDMGDLVSRRIVSHVRSRPVTGGFVVVRGYALDRERGLLAAIPGVWSVPFERACASSAVFLLAPEDLPGLHQEGVTGIAGALLGPHTDRRLVAEDHGRPLEEIDFPAAIYGIDLRQRAGEPGEQLLANFERAEVPVTPAIAAEFALDPLPGSEPSSADRAQASAA